MLHRWIAVISLIVCISGVAIAEQGPPDWQKNRGNKQAGKGRKKEKKSKRDKGAKDGRDQIMQVHKNANPIDRAQLMLAKGYIDGADTEKATATLDALIATTTDANVASLARISKARVLQKAGDAKSALPIFGAVTGDLLPIALHEILSISLKDNILPDGLAALQASFAAAGNDLDKARIIQAIFQLAERASKNENTEFAIQALSAVPTMMTREQADAIQAVWQSHLAALTAKKEQQRTEKSADRSEDIQDRLERIEDLLKRGMNSLQQRGPRGARGGGQEGRFGEGNPNKMREQAMMKMRELQTQLRAAEERGDEKAVKKLSKTIERIEEGLAKMGNGFGNRKQRGNRDDRGNKDPQQRREKFLRKIDELEAQGRMDEAKELRQKLEHFDAKDDKGRRQNKPLHQEEF